jgi:hypothetical protein
MTLSEDRKKIFCHAENIWYPTILILQPVDSEDVLCYRCLAHLGYTWDLPEFFGMQEKT